MEPVELRKGSVRELSIWSPLNLHIPSCDALRQNLCLPASNCFFRVCNYTLWKEVGDSGLQTNYFQKIMWVLGGFLGARWFAQLRWDWSEILLTLCLTRFLLYFCTSPLSWQPCRAASWPLPACRSFHPRSQMCEGGTLKSCLKVDLQRMTVKKRRMENLRKEKAVKVVQKQRMEMKMRMEAARSTQLRTLRVRAQLARNAMKRLRRVRYVYICTFVGFCFAWNRVLLQKFPRPWIPKCMLVRYNQLKVGALGSDC